MREFIDRIEVSANDKTAKKREIRIVYNFIGAFDFYDAIKQVEVREKQGKWRSMEPHHIQGEKYSYVTRAIPPVFQGFLTKSSGKRRCRDCEFFRLYKSPAKRLRKIVKQTIISAIAGIMKRSAPKIIRLTTAAPRPMSAGE